MDEPLHVPAGWPQAEALFRMQLVMPLLDPLTTAEERTAWRRHVVSRLHTLPNGRARRVSERTLRRWVQQAREAGMDGLVRKPREDLGQGRKVTRQILERAVALKTEEPRRSIPHILRLMAQERGHPLDISSDALWRHLKRLGLSRREKAPKKGLRRFEALRAGDLWQCDVKHGPHLPDPAHPGRMHRAYLITFLDDFSRYCSHSEWFAAEDIFALELAFQKALIRAGRPRRVYVDRALIYQSPVFTRACAKLEIRHILGSKEHPEGRGKLERFHRTVDDEFLLELSREPVSTLEAMNQRHWAWLSEVYHNRVHSETKQTPVHRFTQGDPLPEADPVLVRELFLWEDERTVDKTGCVRFAGRRYQCVPGLEHRRVKVRYHPHRLEALQIWIDRKRYPDATPAALHTERERPGDSVSTAGPPAAYLERLVQQHIERKRRILSPLRLADTKEDDRSV